MTENAALRHDAVRAWIDALTSRGIILQARGSHIAYAPKSAYSGMLANDERQFAKQHRAEIIAALNGGYSGTACIQASQPTMAEAPTPAPAPKPPPCRWCNRSPCIGAEHPAYFDLHPEAREKRDGERQTKEMYASLRLYGPARR